jgi:hypothetical protein
MKRAFIIAAVLGLAASLGAQSLVELAKRERERRAQFQGRPGAVVTSRELALVKKTNAVVVLRAEDGGDEGPATEAAGAPAAVGLLRDRSEAGSEAAGQPAAQAQDPDEPLADTSEGLADQLRSVDALVEDLTSEMNMLRQQYESQNAMVPGFVIQERLDETGQRLARAQARQSAIEAKMTRQGLPVRKRVPAADR